jgi:alkanesulfonate monooxygenase SsuD/methylene tetrahydromethanopterin reductase-like flavin-dependent oxidoreductase (luciferase family)
MSDRGEREAAMKFMFFSEAETLPGASYQTRYWELVEQVIHAEKWGFDSFGVSEQQYAIGGISTSCPEVLFGYLFALTKTLRFAHAITLLPKKMNHALRIASRTAVQDILSNGRIELGVGRGNTTLALRAFEVDLEKNRDEVNEGIQVLKKAFTQDPFMFYGEHYKIPPRSLVPKPLQTPHPPIYVAATSPESHRLAGGLGVGVYSWSNFMGWDARNSGRPAARPRPAASTSTRARARSCRPIARTPTRSPRRRRAMATSNGSASRSTGIRASPRWRRATPT